MADSEAKARQKMAEAEKKGKKGGGLFGFLGGGGSTNEACDLYIQDDVDVDMYESDSAVATMDGGDPIRCPADYCLSEFYRLVDLEEHYQLHHSFECQACRAVFPNHHALEVHHDEEHSMFFQAAVGRSPRGAHFRCFAPECAQAFASKEGRNAHCRTAHSIDDPRARLEVRKLPQAARSGRTDLPQTSAATTFGEEQERMFAERRRIAANLFKVAKNWTAAGDAFVRSAELHGSQGDAKHDCASNYSDAGNCYRKVDPQRAVDCYLKTAEIYTDMGRFNMAAKTHTTIAEIFETEAPNKEQCMHHYQKAADYYKGEEAKSSATKCLIKVAQFAAELEQYRKAIEVFEEIAIWEADHPTLKYAAKTHFFQALLCYLCLDLLDSQHALKRYEDLSPSFAESREYKLVKELLLCMEEHNADQFTEAVRNYDKISKLDPWHTSLLLKTKKLCGEEEEEDLR